MLEVKQKRLLALFLGVGVLVLAQLTWWTVVFLDDVRTISQLRQEVNRLREEAGGTPVEAREQERANRRRVMFLSESITFGLLSLLGLYLIYQAMRSEAWAREIERNFIDVVTHESKTPITAMKLRLESLRDGLPPGDERAAEVQLALEEVRRLSSIFDKAMGLNRLERGVSAPEDVSLGELISGTGRRMEPLFRANDVRYGVDVQGDPWVRVDVFQFQNALQGLLENAVLYHPGPDRRVEVRVFPRGGSAVIVVSDNGPGIHPKDRAYVFDRFYRGKHGRRGRPVPGTGLGLYIVRRIVENHQGAIRLLSSVSGTAFEIEIPLAKEAMG